jgi:hypothetical protein
MTEWQGDSSAVHIPSSTMTRTHFCSLDLAIAHWEQRCPREKDDYYQQRIDEHTEKVQAVMVRVNRRFCDDPIY